MPIYKEVGRKGLDEIVKLALLERCTPQAVGQMWLHHHDYAVQYVGKVISRAAYTALSPRLQRNPFFIIPVFRDKGLFNVMVNNQRDLSLVCPLGEYQKQGDMVQPHMTMQFFTELMRSKGLVLMRSELKDKVLTRQDAYHVTNTFLRYYTIPSCFQFVEDFNHNPSQFDYHRYLRHMKEDAKAWSSQKSLHHIDILDKKFTWTDRISSSYNMAASTPDLSPK
eukprot:GGOE01013853.1.p1 GENE.GGOE01013853.1~~GGOE01013853.1.p1  ORF type:complete len:223 (-),score=65.54 GGOE01013853.1:279-947(-)